MNRCSCGLNIDWVDFFIDQKHKSCEYYYTFYASGNDGIRLRISENAVIRYIIGFNDIEKFEYSNSKIVTTTIYSDINFGITNLDVVSLPIILNYLRKIKDNFIFL